MGDYGGVLGQHTARLAVAGAVLPFTGLDVRLVLVAGLVLTLVGAVLLRLTWRPKGELEDP